MSKCWVRVVDNRTTDYLMPMSPHEARKLFEEQPIKKIKKIAESSQVEHSHWEVESIRNEDGTPLATCPECQCEDVVLDEQGLLCPECGHSWQPEKKE